MIFTEKYKLEKAGYDGHGKVFYGCATSVSDMPCVELQRADLLNDWLASGEWEPTEDYPLPSIIVPSGWVRRLA